MCVCVYVLNRRYITEPMFFETDGVLSILVTLLLNKQVAGPLSLLQWNAGHCKKQCWSASRVNIIQLIQSVALLSKYLVYLQNRISNRFGKTMATT